MPSNRHEIRTSSRTLILSPFFFFNVTATTEIYTLSLHDALPISGSMCASWASRRSRSRSASTPPRSEEHTSELQSRVELVCRLLLEKNKKNIFPPSLLNKTKNQDSSICTTSVS